MSATVTDKLLLSPSKDIWIIVGTGQPTAGIVNPFPTLVPGATWDVGNGSIFIQSDANGVQWRKTSAGVSGWGQSAVTSQGAYAITLSPNPLAIAQAGAPQQLLPTVTDQSGTVLSGQTIDYTSSNPAVAMVSTSGLVTGVTGGGVATITATVHGTSISTTDTVTTAASILSGATISPISAVLVGSGATQTFTAAATDQFLKTLSGQTFSYASSNTGVATVNSSTGVATYVGPGTCTITATDGAVTAVASLTASATVTPVLTSIVVTPSTLSLPAGTTQTIAATGYAGPNGTGATVAFTPVWSSSNTAVATVNSSTGAVTAVAQGTCNILATSGAVHGQCAVSIATSPTFASWDFRDGTLGPYAADLTFGNGMAVANTGQNAIEGVYEVARVVPSSSGDSDQQFNFDLSSAQTTLYCACYYRLPAGYAGLLNSTNNFGTQKLIRLRGAGYGAFFGTLDLNNGGFEFLFDFDSNNPHYFGPSTTGWPGDAGHTIELGVVLNTTGPGSTATIWIDQVQYGPFTSSVAAGTPGPGIVSFGGVVNGPHFAGTDYFAAAGISGARIGQFVPALSNNITNSVALTPSNPSLTVGSTQQLTATSFNSSGVALTGKSFTWNSTTTSVATVSSAGLVSAVSAGTTTITATDTSNNTVSAGDTVTVTASQTVNAITLTPTTASLAIAATQQVTPVATNLQGGTISGVSFTYASSTPAAASVSSSGLITGVGAGTTNVTAAAGGKTSNACAVTVTADTAPNTVVVTGNPSVIPTKTATLVATVKNAEGVVITPVPVGTWSSATTAHVTVNSSTGVITGVATGSSVISYTTTSGGKVGSLTANCYATPTLATRDFSDGLLHEFGTDTTFQGDCSLVQTNVNPITGNYQIKRAIASQAGGTSTNGQINYPFGTGLKTFYYAFYYQQDAGWTTSDGYSELVTFRQAGYGSYLGHLQVVGSGMRWVWDSVDGTAGAVNSTGLSTATWAGDTGHLVEVSYDTSANPCLVTVYVDGVSVIAASDAVSVNLPVGIASFGAYVTGANAAKNDYVSAIGVSASRIGVLY